jgi:hypothetical protein
VSTKIRFACNNCERSLSADSEKVGKKLRCPDCQTVLTVPAESSATPPKSAGTAKRDPAEPKAPAQKKTSEKRPTRDSAAVPSESDGAEEPRQRKRRKRNAASDDPHDIWSQPLSSYSSPAIEEHEYEQLGIQPKRAKVKDDDNSGSDMTLKGPVVFFAVGMLVGIVSIVLAFTAPSAGRITGFAAIGLGGLLSMIGHWKIRETAFQESSSCGFKYVWVPFYQPYYILSRFAYIKIPFLVSILGNIILFLGVTGLVLSNIQLEKTGGA